MAIGIARSSLVGLIGEKHLDSVDHRGNDKFTDQCLPSETPSDTLDVLRRSLADSLGGAKGAGNRHRVAVEIGDVQNERLPRILMDMKPNCGIVAVAATATAAAPSTALDA